jgi:hypothetical protein
MENRSSSPFLKILSLEKVVKFWKFYQSNFCKWNYSSPDARYNKVGVSYQETHQKLYDLHGDVVCFTGLVDINAGQSHFPE